VKQYRASPLRLTLDFFASLASHCCYFGPIPQNISYSLSGEARNQRPGEYGGIEFPMKADEITLARDVFDLHCWKEKKSIAVV
jgi:hypothetical protein